MNSAAYIQTARRRARLLTGIVCMLIGALPACAQNTRIIRQTPTTAIIAGEGDSRIEAELAALERAAELFVEYHQTREMECSQEYRGSGNNAVYPANAHYPGAGLISESRAFTFWQCVVFAATGPTPRTDLKAGD
ncbi:MAG: hypothetical protein RIF32_05680 [Leptospirales bacterium]